MGTSGYTNNQIVSGGTQYLFIKLRYRMRGHYMEYQLEIKQIVDFPRCRIYRDFVRSLIAFLLHRTLLLCKLPFLLPPDGTHHLSGRSRRMDLYACRPAGMVPLPLPAPGYFHPEPSGRPELYHFFSA